MEWLNYHHLLYFWAAAKHGGVSAASAALDVAQPTVSAQIQALERALGMELFAREGRNLRLTDEGRMVFGYASEIFETGRELLDAVRGRSRGRLRRFRVGVTDAVPKVVAFRLLGPALQLPETLRMVCREAAPLELAARLAEHEIELAISEQPLPPGGADRLLQTLLGKSTIAVFAAPKLARSLRRGFPRSLAAAPFLLPGANAALRRNLDGWLAAHDIVPNVRAEFDDSALLKIAGEAGVGAFAAPAALGGEIATRHGVLKVGELPGLDESYYMWSAAQRVQHPAVAAIVAAASGAFG